MKIIAPFGNSGKLVMPYFCSMKDTLTTFFLCLSLLHNRDNFL